MATDKRMIHQKIFESEQFNRLTLAERLLYIALIDFADDEGRFRMDASFWKRRVFYSDRIGQIKVQKMLDHITETALIVRYKVKECVYARHPNWNRYQTLRNDRCKPSDFPPPPADILPPNDNQLTAQDKVRKDNLNKDNGETNSKEINLNPKELMNRGLKSFEEERKNSAFTGNQT